MANLYTGKLNYLPLFVKIKKDLENWKDLPITLMGRVNCIKMNIFPRIQYLFQSIPYEIPQKNFKDLNLIIRKFLWKGKLARVGMEKLTWNYIMGGLQLPNFQNYYKAAQLKFVNELFDSTKSSAWIKIKLNNIGENFKVEVIYKWDTKLISIRKKNSPILKHLLEIWNKTDKEIGGK